MSQAMKGWKIDLCRTRRMRSRVRLWIQCGFWWGMCGGEGDLEGRGFMVGKAKRGGLFL